MTRFTYFDSLRGIAALIVVIGHFFPESQIKSLPLLNLLTDTKLSVCIFFILSGFVLTKEKFDTNVFHLAIYCFSRFIRLLIPVSFVSIFVYLLFYFGFFYLEKIPAEYISFIAYQDHYKNEITIIKLINFIFFESFFLYDSSTSLIPPAWTMRPELFGSLFIFSLCWFFSYSRININVYLLCILAVLIFFTRLISLPFIYYFGFFLMGMSFRKMYNSKLTYNIKIEWFIYLLLLKTILEYYNIDNFYLDFIFASTIIYFVMNCNSIHIFLNKKVFLFLGKISFPLYLLHVPIISSLGLHLISHLNDLSVNYIYGLWIVFISVITISLIASTLLLKIETFSIFISRVIRKLNFKR